MTSRVLKRKWGTSEAGQKQDHIQEKLAEDMKSTQDKQDREATRRAFRHQGIPEDVVDEIGDYGPDDSHDDEEGHPAYPSIPLQGEMRSHPENERRQGSPEGVLQERLQHFTLMQALPPEQGSKASCARINNTIRLQKKTMTALSIQRRRKARASSGLLP